MKFTENSLEESIINLFQEIGIQHLNGERIEREKSEIIFKDDLTDFLKMNINQIIFLRMK